MEDWNWAVHPDTLSWSGSGLADTCYRISTFSEDEVGNPYLADFASSAIYQVAEDPQALLLQDHIPTLLAFQPPEALFQA